MGQTLLRLKQLKIGIKQPKKFSFTLISFSNEVDMLDLSKHLFRHWATFFVLFCLFICIVIVSLFFPVDAVAVIYFLS